MKPILFILFISVTLFSCKKEDKKCTQDMGGASGSYRIASAKYKASAGAPEQNFYDVQGSEACERDDQVTLHSNGTYTYTDAGVKCTPTGDDIGTWTLSGAVLTLDGDVYSVQTFDCSAMVISATNVVMGGDQLTIILARL